MERKIYSAYALFQASFAIAIMFFLAVEVCMETEFRHFQPYTIEDFSVFNTITWRQIVRIVVTHGIG